ncbi:hypothetical protein NDA03_05760 [Trichocoleus sp. Lan]|jgi:hypothetical protein|uniref:hypothetical protein n=1 Tax=Cyanophyceae TaxID=3028117 RepID=UPI0016865AC4|nr:hypothetical protein [Coleofasciculus sp. FACHB-542]MBD2084576.1 hypothetical protein [Coleofasciculus sp. FACHB-542]
MINGQRYFKQTGRVGEISALEGEKSLPYLINIPKLNDVMSILDNYRRSPQLVKISRNRQVSTMGSLAVCFKSFLSKKIKFAERIRINHLTVSW